MDRIRSHRELKMWQKAIDAAMAMFAVLYSHSLRLAEIPSYPFRGFPSVSSETRSRAAELPTRRRAGEVRDASLGTAARDRSNKTETHAKLMNILTLSRSHVLKFSCLHASAAFLPLILLGLAGLPIRAASNVTATGWLQAVPVPGITCSNSSGVYLKGNVHVVRILSDDERARGRLQAWMDVAYQPDGTAIFSGPAYSEVGNWDSAGTTFTPTGGVWALNYSGVVHVDGSSQYSMAGYGIGGNIEGLRLSATMTRANQEPTTPYLGSGTITPAPLNIRDVVDDFANDQFTWPARGVGARDNPTGTFFASETNQQLTIGGTWPRPSSSTIEATAWANPTHPWVVSAGQTIEARVDVLALSPTAAGAQLALWGASGGAQAYYVLVGRGGIALAKLQWNGLAIFRAVQAPLKDTNIMLSLALTPVGNNVVLMGKVLDKDSGGVMAQVVATDTPASDPTLSASELAAVIGGRVWPRGIVTDPVGPPLTSGACPLISLHQESDVAPVTAFAIFDNLELQTYEVPQVGYERALRLFWPDTGMNFVVEGTTDLKSPWLPVQSSEIPGVHYFTVPTSAQQGFFQLQQAP